MAGAGKGKTKPRRRADDGDKLDGCDVDFTQDPVADKDLLKVILGNDPKKHAAYRRLFAKGRRRR